MNIKEFLKVQNITLTTLARKLDISRPTLDNYILAYETGKKINSEKIQIAFDEMFGNINNNSAESTMEFYSKLDYYSKIIRREKILGMTDLSADKSDKLTDLFYIMINEAKKDNYDANIYEFVKFLIKNYKEIDNLIDISLYYLTLNSIVDYEELDTNRQIGIATFYKLIRKYNHGDIKDKKNVDDFRNRIFEIRKEKEKKNKEIEKIIISKLSEATKNGENLEKLSFDQLVELLKK